MLNVYQQRKVYHLPKVYQLLPTPLDPEADPIDRLPQADRDPTGCKPSPGCRPENDADPRVDRQTPVKTLPCPKLHFDVVKCI